MKTLQTFSAFNSALSTAEMETVQGGGYSAHSYMVGTDTVSVFEWSANGHTYSNTLIHDAGGNLVYSDPHSD